MDRTRRIIAALILAVVATSCASAGTTGETPAVPGRYQVVGSFRPKVDDAAEVIEVFSFESPYCFKLAQDLPDLLARYETRVRWVQVPVVSGDESPLAAKLFLIAQKYNKGQEVKRALFEARHVKGENLGDPKVVGRIAGEHKIGDRFSAMIFSREINEELDRDQQVVKTYRLIATPSAVVNRSLLVTPSIAGGSVELMRADLAEILQSLVGW